MKAPLLALTAVLLTSALGSLSCAATRFTIARPYRGTPCPPSEVIAPLPSLGHDPKPFELERSPDASDRLPVRSAPSYTHRFELETSGTTAALRAVTADEGQPVLVVGDRGTALVRDPKSGWKSEQTGTTEDLFALSRAPSRIKGEAGSYLAVGSHGVALVRSPEGAWQSEATGTLADLHAIWGGSLVVGDGGVMVARSPEGSFRRVPTHTTANLHAIGRCDTHICAVGDGGVIVDCSFATGEPVCVPRRPPTTAALRVVSNEVFILGEGVWLSIAPRSASNPDPPPEWQPWRLAGPSVAGSDARAAARNHWVGAEMLVAGRRGAVWLVGNFTVMKHPVQRIDVPYTVDFHGVTYERTDGFLVGDAGTIVKLGVMSFRPPTTCLAATDALAGPELTDSRS